MAFMWLNNIIDGTSSLLGVYMTAIMSFFIAVIIYMISPKNVEYTASYALVTIIVIGIITCVIFLVLTNSGGSNINNALSSTTYPVPPHLGLDGVSLQNRYSS
jgi:ethanolamine transporter EutH